MFDTYVKIKKVLSTGSGSCVVLRQGDPYCVVMTWQEYEKFANINEDSKNGRDKIKDVKDIDINSIPV